MGVSTRVMGSPTIIDYFFLFLHLLLLFLLPLLLPLLLLSSSSSSSFPSSSLSSPTFPSSPSSPSPPTIIAFQSFFLLFFPFSVDLSFPRVIILGFLPHIWVYLLLSFQPSLNSSPFLLSGCFQTNSEVGSDLSAPLLFFQVLAYLFHSHSQSFAYIGTILSLAYK